MNHKINFLIGIVFIFSISVKAGETPKISVPDSLIQGVEVNVYEVENPNAKYLSELKIGKLFDVFRNDEAGLADWKSNYNTVPKGLYYITLKGYLLIPESKSYLFNLQGYDGSKLFLDGREIANNDGEHDFKEIHAEMYLEAGLHRFEIKAFNNGSKSVREVSLAWNGHTQEINHFDWVPARFLFAPKSKIEKLKFNASVAVDEPVTDVNAKKDYTNSVHPSFDLTTIHDENFNPLVGGIDFFSNGKMVVCTWDSLGQVFLLENVQSTNPKDIKVKRIALGLAEPLGVKIVDDKLYVLQKQELTQLIDTDGDDIIDEYRTICNAWGATGNFHEFAFGLVFKEGYFYAALATAIQPGGKSTIPQNKDRGKCIKIGLDGSYEIVASGLRTPNGIGIGVDGEIFIADNQGDWLPSCKIVHVTKGAFFGSYSVNLYDIGKFEEKPPVVWLPQGEIGNSATQPGIMKDGPYAGQMIHGDVTHGGLKRVFVEKIQGQYQGIVFPFTQGFEAGVNRICWGPDNALYVGGVGSTGNWGQIGKKWTGLQKMKYNNKSTFEILAVRAKRNGIEIEFTEPLPTNTGSNLAEYEITQWKYVPTMQYGGPKVDPSKPQVLSASISKERTKVFLEINDLKQGYVVYINLPKTWKSKNGNEIWTNKGWYTLNYIPEEKGVITAPKPKTTTTPTKPTSAAPKAAAPKEPTDAEVIAIGPKLIDESGCLQCHAKNSVVLGPSFKMIKDKYKADPATIAKLVEKVYKGGSGVWGDQAMGANTHLDKADIKKLVRYILAMP
jgi:cytochrome c